MDSWINAWELADIVKNQLKQSQMSLGSAQIASAIIIQKSGLRSKRFMPEAAEHTAFPYNLPVMKAVPPVPFVSTGVRSLKAKQAFVEYGMSREEK